MASFDPNKQRIPNVAQYANTADSRRLVLMLVIGSAAVVFFSNTGKAIPGKRGSNVKTGFQAMAIPAWIGVYVALAILSDFDTTSDLARVFAWLIFIAVLIYSGPAAFANIQTFITSSGAPPSAPPPKQPTTGAK